MKKIYTIIIITLISISAVSAQKLISFGPRASMTSTLNYSKGMVKTTGNVGWKFGATVEVRPLKFLGISLDLMYSSQGFSQNFDNEALKFNLGYVDIPIMANFYIWKGLSLKAGIQPSIKLHGSVSLAGIESSNVSTDITENMKNGKFDIPVGIGYSFGFGLSIDARYNIGTTNIYNGSSYNGDTFEFGVAWRF